MERAQVHDEFITSLYKIGAIQFGSYQLKSGQSSPIYINLRKIISYPALLDTTANLLWNAIKDTSFDLICGVPYTALPFATVLSLKHHIPMIMRRKEKKDYGTKQMIEGEFHPGQRCLIVEDVITTGSSIIETAAELEKVGIQVTHLAVLIDREQGGRQSLEKQYSLHTVLSLSTLLKSLLCSSFLPAHEYALLTQFAKEHAL